MVTEYIRELFEAQGYEDIKIDDSSCTIFGTRKGVEYKLDYDIKVGNDKDIIIQTVEL